MKKLVCLLFAAISLSAFAQTNPVISTNIPTGPVQFAANLGSYLTSFNYALSWTNTPVDIWAGANFQSGLQTSAELGASYDVYRSGTNWVVDVNGAVRNAGIAGTIVSGQLGVGWAFLIYDTKLEPYIDVGYSAQLNSWYAEPGVRIKKKMTISTYVGAALAYDIYFRGHNQKLPTLFAGPGWAF